VAGLEAALALRELAEDKFEIVLVAPEEAFSYRPLAVAETFELAEVYRVEVSRLASDLSLAHVRDSVAAVEADRGRVILGSGRTLSYDALVLACGARPEEALSGSLTFRGEEDEGAVRALLSELREGSVGSAVFALPGGVAWPLALYELALLAAAHVAADVSFSPLLSLVTPETAPLAHFGRSASDAVARLLHENGIAVHTQRYPAAVEAGRLRLVPDGFILADRVVALARLRGPAISGVPSDADGFVVTDPYGRVPGLLRVFAAGDATAFPVKQGGIAAQQADAAAQTLAAELGAPIEPEPFRPVLSGLLLTGGAPTFMRAEITGGRGETSRVEAQPLWWPPSKISGRLLGPYLQRTGLPVPQLPPGNAVIPVELPIDSPIA
jgi:sulfide:quinone oxidoreductase